ncbi:MAG: ABC transporter ATP-binding protein [Anaerolineaceae bacterium]|jgi:putative ABC transport system ATP-binding protein|nr:ABC transporter ATP-binding protein [Anaerolineaceae bacterium]MDD4043046.1 ABC transporter ATP-binding protein [Anaerolineaceae bacterium]MDD4577276.1 ABC transporter ATP-binding protein [Anaerolineaceae bacterium]
MIENTPAPVIKIRDLTKVFHLGGSNDVHALRGVSLDIYPGEMVAIMGPSGSGKSTLMNMIGCLDSPTSGDYYLDGLLVSNLDDDELAVVRNRKIGFIFQKYNLLARATAVENVELPLRYSDDPTNITERAIEMLQLVGLGDRLKHQPNELSGGQQQRVAIARALVNHPAIILADEPTGNLDSVSGQEVMDLLLKLNREKSTTIVLVTHDKDVAKQAQRTIRLFDGKIMEGEQR